MRVLLTGGAGFIGSHIADALLERGHEVHVLDDLSSGSRENLPANVPLHVGDICDAALVARVFDEVRPQRVCHQAAQLSVAHSVRDPLFDARINVIGLLNVLTNAVRVGVERFVFASSGGVLYGDVAEPVSETAPANPISPYGITKATGEQYLRFFQREHGLESVALRYANVYGPRQNPHGEAGVVAIFCQRMLAGQPVTVNGDGRYIRDYVYVGDVARANVAALEMNLPEPFVPLNIGTAVGTDVNELAQLVRTLAQETRHARGFSGQVPAPQHGPARPGDLRSSLISWERARELLHWEPQVNLPTGLAATVTWFADHGAIQ